MKLLPFFAPVPAFASVAFSYTGVTEGIKIVTMVLGAASTLFMTLAWAEKWRSNIIELQRLQRNTRNKRKRDRGKK